MRAGAGDTHRWAVSSGVGGLFWDERSIREGRKALLRHEDSVQHLDWNYPTREGLVMTCIERCDEIIRLIDQVLGANDLALPERKVRAGHVAREARRTAEKPARAGRVNTGRS